MINEENDATLSHRIKQLRAGCGNNPLVHKADTDNQKTSNEDVKEETKKEIEEEG